MKIKFDSNQKFQLDAIRAVVDVFDGQPLAQGEFEIRLDAAGGVFLSEFGVGNLLVLDDGRLLDNVRVVRERNSLAPNEKLEAIGNRIPQLTLNVGIAPRKKTAGNGAEYIEVRVSRNAQTVAATSDGRYFIRVSDETRPLLPDELTRLISDKTAYVWEAQTVKRVPRDRLDNEKLNRFVEAIQRSDRVSEFIKAKTIDELLDYYLFASGKYLTNLGILWVGRRDDRATSLYAPGIQFIKYDELERKVNKMTWDNFSLNPMELIEAVWNEVPDWRETYELPDGLKKKIAGLSLEKYETSRIKVRLQDETVWLSQKLMADLFQKDVQTINEHIIKIKMGSKPCVMR